MKKPIVLAHDQKLGNIQQCVCGVVHVHCGSVSLRFKEDAFLNFALMIKEASSQLLDRGLTRLFDESEES